MFEFAVDYTHFLLCVLCIALLGVVHQSYDKRYRKKFKEYRDAMDEQYVELYKKAKNQIRIDLINEGIKNGECPVCGKKEEK
jgi:hypothetical protein